MLLRIILLLRPPKLAERLRHLLEEFDVLTRSVSSAVELWQSLHSEPADLVFASEAALSSPAESAVEGILGLPESPGVVVVRQEDDPETRARLVGAGVEAVIFAGMSDEAILEMLGAVVTKRRELLQRRLQHPSPRAEVGLEALRSRSPGMSEVLELARRVVRADTSLLILGETGVGKEHLARAIHEQGPRARAPFIAVNCGAIVESLMESELFGHVQGAFTGATRAHRGHFELAHRGTIFLDEIGEMPTHVQVKLLRVLQDRTIQRVGGEDSIEVDVRIIAATNRDLAQDIRGHRFRPDLYYRIGVVSIAIPPLRERREDIPELVLTQFQRLRQQLRPELQGVEESAMRALVGYDWPGNVRELVNVLERAMLICEGDRIGLADLPAAFAGSVPPRGFRRGAKEHGASFAPPGPGSVPTHERSRDGRVGSGAEAVPTLRKARERVLLEFERDYLVAQLQATRGRVGEAAKRSGISSRALFEKMKRHGLRKEDFKD
jgi:DNA-binding NtrC family response regulator